MARIIGLAPVSSVLSGSAVREADLDACISKPVRQDRLREALAVAVGNATPDAPALDAAKRAALVRGGARIRAGADSSRRGQRRESQRGTGTVASAGCSARSVTNGRELLTALEREPFDIVLMDCQMPELDGYETTRAIRNGKRLDRRRGVRRFGSSP
jgi:CheY-like chemotaxis protein